MVRQAVSLTTQDDGAAQLYRRGSDNALSRPGSNDEEVGQVAACKILQLIGGHVGDGIQKIGGLLLGDVGGDHLAIAFRHLEHAINTADEVIIVYCRSVMIIFLH